MGKRRNVGEWVWLKPNSGFVGTSHALKVQIMPEASPEHCLLECDDKHCQEWATLHTELCPECGEKHSLYHVSECQMLDEPWKAP